jgi:hypothetical protein
MSRYICTVLQEIVVWDCIELRTHEKELVNGIMKVAGDRDSSVSIATRYGLVGPVFESRCGRNFLSPSRLATGQPNLRYSGYWDYFTGVKRPGRGNKPPHLAPRLKKG